MSPSLPTSISGRIGAILSDAGALFARSRRQVRTDLRTDPHLRYVLLLAVVLCSFWFWHRLPNFATRDEKSRLIDPLVAYGQVVDEPSFASLKEGITWGRAPFGATFYLFGLALLPALLAAIVLGGVDAFASVGFPSPEFGYYPAWQSMPEWVWTVSLVFVRLFNVVFAVGCVYLTYRIGTSIRNRATGNLAALLLVLSFGFLTIAHEGGEDMPALFFALLSFYLVYRYVETGDGTVFLAGSAAGGVAIAFKLTAAPVILVIGFAYLLRAHRSEAAWHRALFRPWLLFGGAAMGLVFIALGFPTLLVGSFDVVVERIFSSSLDRASHATGPDAPIWWWFLRGYFSGLSLPLFVAGVAGVVAGAVSLARRESGVHGIALVLAALVTYLLMFSQWHDFRVHHLIPTFPLVVLVLADRLDRLRELWPTVARASIAILLVTSGAYAVTGDLGFASMPRDQAEHWLVEDAPENATVEVYRRDFQDTAVPFDMNVNHLYGPEDGDESVDPCPQYIQLGYRDLLYLDDGTYYRNDPERASYVDGLLNGAYNYEVAATFGPEPRGPGYVPQRPSPGSLSDLLRLGIVPQTDQYADEQELAANQFTIVLERTGSCDGSRDPPF